MARLIPCTACSRPIRVNEESCPFCAAAAPADRNAPAAVAVPRGASRARRYAASAAVAAGITAAAGCGPSQEAKNPQDDTQDQKQQTNQDQVQQTNQDQNQQIDRHQEEEEGGNRNRHGDDRLPNMPYGCVFPDPDARVRT